THSDAKGRERYPNGVDVPENVTVTRTGTETKVSFPNNFELDVPESAIYAFMVERIPRVEIIRPQETVPDSTTSEKLKTEEHAFMRGILYYAGIEKEEFTDLFAQTD